MAPFTSRLRAVIYGLRDALGWSRSNRSPDLVFRRPPRPADRPVRQEGEEQEAAPPIAVASATPLVLYLIAILLAFYTLYFAASLILPIALAALLSMLLAPVVNFFEGL